MPPTSCSQLHELSIAAGTIEAGTVAAIKLHLDGMLRGRTAIALEWIWRIDQQVAAQWPVGDSRWILHIDGNPTVDSEITLATEHDAGRAVSLSVATLLPNAVPTVCKAGQHDFAAAWRQLLRAVTDHATFLDGSPQHRTTRDS